MSSKRSTVSDWTRYEEELPTPPPPTLASDGEAHAKLKRNLNKALERHSEILDIPIVADMPIGDKRLVHDAATATLKAALTTDKTVLKARQDNTMERVLLRLLFYRYLRGLALSPEYVHQLRTATRKELEAALAPRELAKYDGLEWS